MATFKAEIQNKRADGTYNVRIRVTHNREIRRISTHIYVTDDDLTRGGKIKNVQVLGQCEALVTQCRNICNGMGYESGKLPIDVLVKHITSTLLGESFFRLDFFEYTRQKAAEMRPGTASAYLIMLSALQRYLKRDYLDISEINTAFLREFEKFIENEPSQQGNNRKPGKEAANKPKSGRAVSAYLAYVRAMHNRAKAEFNDEEQGVINIPLSPFKKFKLKAQPQTRKRALSVEIIQKIIDLPYEPENVRGGWNRFNLAKDCFLISFGLIGMNSVDMYYAGPMERGMVVKYNRRKTAIRREDQAEMKVKAEPCIYNLMWKYRDNKQLFRFYRHYATPFNFNAAINKGLKQIGAKIGVDDLQFYAARHSWATIARSRKGKIDKATVHEALNHVDNSMKVTDIYIKKDWTVIWKANCRVLGFFNWPESEDDPL